MEKEEYKKYVEKRAKKSPVLKNTFIAFMTGGLVCVIGQAFMDLYLRLGAEKQNASTFASITIIFFAITLTGFGVFDNLAKVAGAGLSVPISGFANSVSSEAIDANQRVVFQQRLLKYWRTSLTASDLSYTSSAQIQC